jgi:hypothetical protein
MFENLGPTFIKLGGCWRAGGHAAP